LNPIIEYSHSGSANIGVANVGGYVYRGKEVKGLFGDYVFADWSRGFVKGDGSVFAARKDGESWRLRELAISSGLNGRLNLFIRGIGQDEEGELYLLTSETTGPSGRTGKIFKIIKTDGDESLQEESSTDEVRVTIDSFLFNPPDITVPNGTKVIWTNNDQVPHTVTSQGYFDSKILSNGETFSFTFSKTGVFEYICSLHPNMKGKVTVE
ncbi:MAG: cupredoxin family copper-binding protein, partial [Candidatus Colwellbacteria bacterium]|nr:cupredoxin family copper-binding protein [Candidatus Colwellbacteria bacterium]